MREYFFVPLFDWEQGRLTFGIGKKTARCHGYNDEKSELWMVGA